MLPQQSESRELDKVIVRLPDGMRDRLKAAAADNSRSMNAEIVQRLGRTFDEDAAIERDNYHYRMLEKVGDGTLAAHDIGDVLSGEVPAADRDYLPSPFDRLSETIADLVKQQQRLDERLANGLSRLSAERQGEALDVRATLTALTKLERRLSSVVENAGGSQNARLPKDEPEVAAATKGRVRKTP